MLRDEAQGEVYLWMAGRAMGGHAVDGIVAEWRNMGERGERIREREVSFLVKGVFGPRE